MILGNIDLLKRLDQSSDDQCEDPLAVCPMPDRDVLRKSGAASIDLRLGCWFSVLRPTRSALLDIEKAGAENLPGNEQYITKMHYTRFGDKFVLGATLEWIRVPKDLAGYVTSRSSWGRRGLIIATATGVHPGFTGCLTLELTNSGEMPIALYPGMAITQFFLHKMAPGSIDSEKRSNLSMRRQPHLGKIKLDDFSKKLMQSSD